jgi:hypothetical protein
MEMASWWKVVSLFIIVVVSAFFRVASSVSDRKSIVHRLSTAAWGLVHCADTLRVSTRLVLGEKPRIWA